MKLNKKISPEVLGNVAQIEDYSKLADTIASHLAIKIADKQEILEIATISERLERVYTLMESEISVLQVERKIRSRVKRQMEKTQREYYLERADEGDPEGARRLATSATTSPSSRRRSRTPSCRRRPATRRSPS